MGQLQPQKLKELDVLEGGEEEEKEEEEAEEAMPEVPRPSQAPFLGPSASRSSRPVSFKAPVKESSQMTVWTRWLSLQSNVGSRARIRPLALDDDPRLLIF